MEQREGMTWDGTLPWDWNAEGWQEVEPPFPIEGAFCKWWRHELMGMYVIDMSAREGDKMFRAVKMVSHEFVSTPFAGKFLADEFHHSMAAMPRDEGEGPIDPGQPYVV